MRMKDIPWFNRPWTKMSRNGIESLDDAELLALVFIQGTKKLNALELANTVLNKHNFHKLEEVATDELTKISGDKVKSFQLKAVAEICKRYTKLQNKGFKRTIDSAKDVYNFFKVDLKNKQKEHLYALLLDAKNKIIKEDLVSVGTLTQSFAHPREVFKEAIKKSANSIILVHNHPSGDHNPSKEDLSLTKKMQLAGKTLGILVTDHIIIGKDNYWSFQEAKNK